MINKINKLGIKEGRPEAADGPYKRVARGPRTCERDMARLAKSL